MLDKKSFKLGEMIALFIGLPLLLISPINPLYSIGLVFLALVYCGWQLKSRLGVTKSKLWAVKWTDLWPVITIRFLIFAIATTLFVAYQAPEDLFVVVLQKPLMWIGISIFYTLVSTLPQEIIYRTYFFSRYSDLTDNKWLFIVLNAAVFCFAHIVFMNSLVFFLTFCGGILFATTYNKSKSLVLTVAEHSLYGVWLFTVGMGRMLYFPMP
ncbi:CPBP family intramembrane metalloprotease [Alteromonadaceae bacterium M269]|nr:CPBP family intramembrane metalloprotease [Alteromonadaceae bacterium M269]